MEISKNEWIKSMSLLLIDDIKEVLTDMQDDGIEIDVEIKEINRLLDTLKKGIEKIS